MVNLEELERLYTSFKEATDKYIVAVEENDFETMKQVVPGLEKAHLEFDKKFIVAQSEIEESPSQIDSVLFLKKITRDYCTIRDELVSVEEGVLETMMELNKKQGIEAFLPKTLSKLRILKHKNYSLPLYR